MAEEKIGEWTQTTLIRFLRDFQDQQPTTFFSKLRVDQLQVDSLLNLKPTQISLLTTVNTIAVGSQGAPPFENGWTNYLSAWAEAGYWKDPFGFVHLKGLVKSGTANTVIFTLPPGYRIQASELFSSHSGEPHALARIDVHPDGRVMQSSGDQDYLSLSGITFRAVRA